MDGEWRVKRAQSTFIVAGVDDMWRRPPLPPVKGPERPARVE